jgi:hypothetical protein
LRAGCCQHRLDLTVTVSQLHNALMSVLSLHNHRSWAVHCKRSWQAFSAINNCHSAMTGDKVIQSLSSFNDREACITGDMSDAPSLVVLHRRTLRQAMRGSFLLDFVQAESAASMTINPAPTVVYFCFARCEDRLQTSCPVIFAIRLVGRVRGGAYAWTCLTHR